MPKASGIIEEKTGDQSAPDDTEDFLSGDSGSGGGAATQTGGAADRVGGTRLAVDEAAGDAPFFGDRHEATIDEATHDEVGNPDRAETADEYLEATPAQLGAAESGEETATSDLHGIDGFEPRQAGQETADAAPPPLQEAGAALEAGQEEFLPVLKALVPTLVSTVGPALAKGVMGKLSPPTRRAIRRPPRPPSPSGTGPGPGPTGPSDIMALIMKLLRMGETASMAATEAGAEVSAALVEEAAAVLELIIGKDDRVRIEQTTRLPWRRYCALRITFPNGTAYRGTGFLIGPRAVATAGHCVYLHKEGGWARRIEVIPGCNGASRPYGQAMSTSFRSVGGWVSGKKPEYDYGCVVLPANAFGGRNLGSFGFAAFDSSSLVARPAVLSGYPGDKPFAEKWGMARRIKAVTSRTLVYDIDTMGGQSGAPVYIKRNGSRYVVGIHNYGMMSGNSATRVTEPVYQRLLGWSRI